MATELVHRAVDRVPQRCRPIFLQVAMQRLEQRIAVRRDVVRLDDDVLAEVPDAESIVGQHAVDERSAARTSSSKFGFMLPLRSSSMMAVIGWISFEKTVSSCFTPLSSTSKLSRVRSGANNRQESTRHGELHQGWHVHHTFQVARKLSMGTRDLCLVRATCLARRPTHDIPYLCLSLLRLS